jgi:hypothetical protein
MPVLGCYFSASGRTFEVDSFLQRTTLVADVVFHRGQPLKVPKGKLLPWSGFSITINHTRVFGDLSPQIPKALRFLRKHQRELLRLSRAPGVSDLRLVFPCCRPAGTYGVERFPAELVGLAGACRISIELSFYPDGDLIVGS